ncbi:hypothetical protein [Halobacteriovorax sp. HLS]|uniref:hypothetical protein n=1 Tax=Halobacteriovorax sp. HLS TaxID=2234000 RepID=UPI000FD992E8|nr:hypothetical protein [Halobacteriovorax sp. HLS]
MIEKSYMINSSREIFIFFLKLSDQLPEFYFHMATMFKGYGISLVPISPKDLKEIKHNSREYIVSVNSDFTKYRNFLVARKTYIDYMVLNKKFCLFDISSFEMADIASRGFRTKSYHYFSLPVNIEETVKLIAISIYEDRKTKSNWPGGVRSKLPSDVGNKV